MNFNKKELNEILVGKVRLDNHLDYNKEIEESFFITFKRLFRGY